MTFAIDIDNNISVLDSAEKIEERQEGTETFSSSQELDALAGKWPGPRLVEIWNSLPGVEPVERFTSRQVAAARIWKAIQNLQPNAGAQRRRVAPKKVSARNKAEMKERMDTAGITNQDAPLRQAAGQAFYNSSPFTLRDLRSRAKTQQLKADFEAYLDGFSPNVQEILDKFRFRNQIQTLVDADILGSLIEKFLDSSINLGPLPILNTDGSERIAGLDNHAMGTI